MYSRARESNLHSLPNDYCGTAFFEKSDAPCDEQIEQRRCEGATGEIFRQSDKHGESGLRIPFLSDIPILSRIRDLGLCAPTFGSEDILILVTAAMLFFSKSGDRTCALMLLLLIFVAE